VGGNALFNSDGVSISSAPIVANAQAATTDQSAQIAQLQSQVAQYQTRETQYQQELTKAADQIRAANDKVQQYQMLITALQNQGIITVGSDGRIYLNR
jgi:chromosome segregation ATPase